MPLGIVEVLLANGHQLSELEGLFLRGFQILVGIKDFFFLIRNAGIVPIIEFKRCVAGTSILSIVVNKLSY